MYILNFRLKNSLLCPLYRWLVPSQTGSSNNVAATLLDGSFWRKIEGIYINGRYNPSTQHEWLSGYGACLLPNCQYVTSRLGDEILIVIADGCNSEATPDTMADNLELTAILNQLLQRSRPSPTGRAGGTGKSGREQIRDNARQIRSEATILSNPAAEQLGLGPCLISTNSVDGR